MKTREELVKAQRAAMDAWGAADGDVCDWAAARLVWIAAYAALDAYDMEIQNEIR